MILADDGTFISYPDTPCLMHLWYYQACVFIYFFAVLQHLGTALDWAHVNTGQC